MTNKEVFEQYGREYWVIEENLYYLLLEYKELVKSGDWRSTNLVGFVKQFMKEESYASIEFAEKSKLDALEKDAIDVTESLVISNDLE